MHYSRSIQASPYPHDYFDLGSQSIIEWAIGGEQSVLNDHFVKQLQKKGKNPSKLFSTIDSSEHFFKENPPIPPALFIFHMSRCGSSYASHYFATNFENRVFYEPHFLIQFIRKTPNLTVENHFKLKQAIQLLGCGALPSQKRLIIKATSGFIRQFKNVHVLFPSTPKVFIYRDPKEVLVSLFEGPPVYLPSKKDGKKKLLLASIEHLEEIFDHVLENIADIDCFIDFTHLKKDIQQLEFQLGWRNNSIPRIKELKRIQQVDSKDNNRKYSPDSIEKQAKWKVIQEKYKVSIEKLEKQFRQLLNFQAKF